MDLPRATTAKERDEIRRKIIRFCRKPRTLKEIKEKFNISGISAAAYLSYQWAKGICTFDRKTKTYKIVKKT